MPTRRDSSGPSGAPDTRELSRRRLHLRLAVLVFALAILGGLHAFWLEPRQLLARDEVVVGLPLGSAEPPRWIHLSDLHIREETPVLRRLLDAVRAERPNWLLISGDLISGSHRPEVMERRLATTTAYLSELRRVAPVLAVQGHSEFQGEVVAALRRAGVRWLSNEGLLLDTSGPLLLGLNEQVGLDARPEPDGRLHLHDVSTFELRETVGSGDGAPALAVVREGASDNHYLHWDPVGDRPRTRGRRERDPADHLADTRGPLSWSGYELTCELWINDPDDGAGVVVHGRFVVGEDRMLRLRRVEAGTEDAGTRDAGTFRLVPHGTAFTTGEPDTGVTPEPRRWYRVRLRTEVEGGDEAPEREGLVRVRAKIWPADAPEPADWQAQVEDSSRSRVSRGTVGLWGWEDGGAAYRRLRVVASDGEVLLEEPFSAPGPEVPAGWREGARGSRLALALARSPAAPPGTPRVVLCHTPGVVLEAIHRGMDLVLAGHTHGGQVRLPVLGALITRSTLGPRYDRGVFRFGSPALQGWTTLYVHSGVGTSILPLRTLNPPRYAVIYPGAGRLD